MPPSGLSQSQLADAREYALRLINDARTAAGLNTVVLDDNTAAQSHAEDMRENCSTGHWGSDGLKPYMRYTLSGGEEYSSENVSGSGFCPTNPDRYISKTIDAHIDEAMNGLMNSPGHRRNILNPHHRKVNIGISYRRPNLWLVQHFVSDYLDYKTKPIIDSGVLKFSGQTKNGATVIGRALGVQIFYDQPPHSLTRGQLHRTYCYTLGTIIASLRKPPGPNAYYPTDTFILSGTGCNDPYDIPIDAAPATSYFDVKPAFTLPWTTNADWITASKWTTEGNEFEVSADLSDLIDRFGDGVYTILIWGEINGEDIPISEYSIFIPPLNETQAHISAHVTPTPTSTPTLTPTPEPSSPPQPTATHTASPTPTITLTPTSTTTPVPTTSSGITEAELTKAREYALKLINDARTAAGLDKATLDDNTAAQSHAEDMKANCFLSHWGADGLKPYMRYSLAGGHQYASVYVSGFDYCPSDPKTYRHQSLEDALSELIHRYLNHVEYRDVILDPNFHMLGFGISHQRPNWWIVLKFVSDFVLYTELPTIHDQTLRLSGEVINGAQIEEDTLAVSIDHDPTPHALTRGQLQHTDCLRHGDRIGALRPPLGDNEYYSNNSFKPTQPRCVDPYFVSVDAPVATSYDFVQPPFLSRERILISATWITATEWSVVNNAFDIVADISNLLVQHGDGVYTIVVWAEVNGEQTPISKYSIFVPLYSPAP